MRMSWLFAVAGCVHAPLAAPPARGAVVYDVAVVSAAGERTVTALYALEATPSGPRTWSVRTLHTAGAVEEGGGTWTFDSAAPTGGDPWPLLLQHAVASVPAEVRFDANGAPEALADPEAWEAAARRAVEALALPREADAAADQVIDPDGLLADLRRTFPGTPPAGTWSRPDRLGPIDAVRAETCTEAMADDARTWTCSGEVVGAVEGAVHLHEGTSTTTIVADARGLATHESSWSGTLLWRDGDDVRDTPVGGRRLVRRR